MNGKIISMPHLSIVMWVTGNKTIFIIKLIESLIKV